MVWPLEMLFCLITMLTGCIHQAKKSVSSQKKETEFFHSDSFQVYQDNAKNMPTITTALLILLNSRNVRL
mgnify:CR=1 FL=1